MLSIRIGSSFFASVSPRKARHRSGCKLMRSTAYELGLCRFAKQQCSSRSQLRQFEIESLIVAQVRKIPLNLRDCLMLEAACHPSAGPTRCMSNENLRLQEVLISLDPLTRHAYDLRANQTLHTTSKTLSCYAWSESKLSMQALLSMISAANLLEHCYTPTTAEKV